MMKFYCVRYVKFLVPITVMALVTLPLIGYIHQWSILLGSGFALFNWFYEGLVGYEWR